MNILFTLCGRAGSKGTTNKNIKDFCGVKLPYFSLSVIDLFMKKRDNNDCCDVVLSTDSKELIEIVSNNPFIGVHIINRCKDLSSDYIGKIDVIRDCLIKMEELRRTSYDLVIDLDITSPLRTDNDLRNLINKSLDTGADVTFSVTSSRRNPYFNQVKKANHGYKRVIDSKYTARQQAPEVYDMNASLYAYKPIFLKNNNCIFDGYVEVTKMYDTGVLDLDNPNDYEIMQVIANYLFENKDDFAELYINTRRGI